jgi:hypothetical protein
LKDVCREKIVILVTKEEKRVVLLQEGRKVRVDNGYLYPAALEMKVKTR